ncbi:hypothetical protein U1Q18_009448 [Sarracenia purpurea var. burkii]
MLSVHLASDQSESCLEMLPQSKSAVEELPQPNSVQFFLPHGLQSSRGGFGDYGLVLVWLVSWHQGINSNWCLDFVLSFTAAVSGST